MNTGEVITSLASTFAALCTSYMAYKFKVLTVNAELTRVAAEKTEVNTNHMREQLVEAVKVVSHEEGRIAGVAEQKSKPDVPPT
jgi:hypothetical protein